jgi:hypothetical protein
MWADNETTTDLLGFSIHTDLIRSVILEPGLLPVTIGVYGDWGGGKTSVLKMLQRDLNPEEHAQNSPEYTKLQRVACLYFNGWLFEGYDDAKSALLSSILVELGDHKRFGPKIRDKALQLIKSVNWMRVARLGLKEVALPALLATATGGASLLPSVVANLAGVVGLGNKEKPKEKEAKTLEWDELFGEASKAEGSADVRTFRQDFAKLIADSDIDTLVILIDDLDRCSPQRIVDNLEAIKLFLSVEKTAFVIGADPRIGQFRVRGLCRPGHRVLGKSYSGALLLTMAVPVRSRNLHFTAVLPAASGACPLHGCLYRFRATTGKRPVQRLWAGGYQGSY